MVESAMVITISTRAAAGVYPDKSGPIIAAALGDLGFRVAGPVIVPDGEAVGAALRDAVAAGHAVVITTVAPGCIPAIRLRSRLARWSNGKFHSLLQLSRGTAMIMMCRLPC